MIGFYDYTVILTYLSLASGIFGIYFAFLGNPLMAIWCLLFSGLCDMFDGKVARTKKNRTTPERQFGIQLDSLCDVICFGVLPGAIGIAVGMTDWWLIIINAIFAICAVIRLAYFNVTEEERQSTTKEARVFFEGLPVTSSAVIFPFVYCFVGVFSNIFEYIYAAALLLIAILYITPVRIPKPRKLLSIVLVFLGITEFVCLILLTINK